MPSPPFSGIPDFVFFAYLALFIIGYLSMAFVGYILRSIALVLHAKKFACKYPILAVIPFAQDYIYGLIVRQIWLTRGKNGPLKTMQFIKPIGTVLYVVIYFVFHAYGSLFIPAFLLVFLAVNIPCFYGFLRGFYAKAGFVVFLHVLLSVIIPFYSGIVMLSLLKRKTIY